MLAVVILHNKTTVVQKTTVYSWQLTVARVYGESIWHFK